MPIFRPKGLLPVDARAQRRELMIEERLIDPLKPVVRCLEGQRVAEMWKAQTRPRPIDSVLDQSRADRIAKNIAEGREEMAVLLDWKTFEPALPDMPMTPVMLVVTPNVTGHPPLHEWA